MLYDQCFDSTRASDRARGAEMKARWREETTLDALDDLVAHLGPLREERKTVLTISDGWQLFTSSRTLAEPTPGTIREMIGAIVDDCLRDGQLDETDLTLSDLRVLSEAFCRMLVTIYHQRIDYPGFEFNAAPKRDRRGIRRVS